MRKGYQTKSRNAEMEDPSGIGRKKFGKIIRRGRPPTLRKPIGGGRSALFEEKKGLREKQHNAIMEGG